MDTNCDILQLASDKGGRRWPDDLKAQIVAETLLPGARVCDVARAYGIRANRISEWRTLAKKGVLVLPSASADRLPQFAPLVIESLSEGMADPVDCAKIEIVKRDVVIRLTVDTSASRIAEIAGALVS